MSDSSSPFGDNLFEKESTTVDVGSSSASVAVDGKAEKKDNRSVVGKVHVGDPEIRGSKFTSYHAYKITTDPPVVDHVFRRFSDFVWLREILVKMFPGVFVPPLPPKKLLGSKDDQVVVERQVDLERFLNRIAIRKFLATSEPFQVFLHQSQLFEERVKELDKQVKTKELTEIISMFKEIFPQPITEITLSDKTDIEFDAMKEFLNNSEQKTQNLLKAADIVAENFEKYLDSISKLNIALNQTYDIEKGYPDRPQPARVEVIDTFLSWQQGEKELINAYHTHIHSIFKYELQDVQAYIEIVKHRYDIHHRYNNTTLKKAKSWDGKPIKNEKQEAEKQADLKRETDEREYLEILNKLILHSQIKHYWAAKMLLFKKQIETFAAAQVGANGKLKEAWEACQRLSRSKSISESTVSLPEWGLDDF